MNAPLPPRAKPTRLSRVESFKLTNYIQEEYVKSGLNDTAFAAQAAEVLLIPHINENHISGIRNDFGIQSNAGRGGSAQGRAVSPRVAELERLYIELSDRIRKLEQTIVELRRFVASKP